MKEISCRCGASKKNFKFDIGPFFIGECCIEAGYNELGELVEDVSTEGVETLEVGLNTLDKIDDLVSEVLEDKPKKRQYHKSGKLNIKKES